MAGSATLSPAGASAAGGGLDVELDSLGPLLPVSRSGGQGRVYAPEQPHRLASTPLVVKLYRSRPRGAARQTLGEMVSWGRSLPDDERRALYRLAAWPLATVSSQGALAGIVMQDLRSRFELPFRMPSGRVSAVMLQLEHLLGPDDYLQQRGLQRPLDTRSRAAVAERICAAFAFLHRYGVVVSDVSPSNLLIAFGPAGVEVALIDCDSMVFHGRQALAPVETTDWQLPAEYGEAPVTPAADDYKLGLLVLRLFARDSEARSLLEQRMHVPAVLQSMVVRALAAEAASRPSATDWQRALRGVLADEHVARRHPGPRGPARTRPHGGAGRGPGVEERLLRRGTPPVPYARQAGGGRLGGGQAGGAGSGMHWPLFTTVWLVAGVLALLLFMHLLAGATLGQGGRDIYELRPGAGEYRTFGGEGRERESIQPEAEARPGEFGPSR